MKSLFGRLLMLELAIVPVVIMVFKTIESRQSAGLVAGSIFIILGGVIVASVLRGGRARGSAAFWAGLIHLFGISLPMVAMRSFHWGEDFNQISIWGMPGPVFHKFSERVYLVLLAATAFDWWRARKAEAARSAPNRAS